MSEPLLSIQQLEVAFAGDEGDVLAVEEVSLDLAPGEILGLVGESGSGKSTLAKCILRVLGPPGWVRSGSILLQGEDTLRMSPEVLRSRRWRQASMVFQSALSALNPVLTIAEQLRDTLLAHDSLSSEAIRSRSLELLRKVRLEPWVLRSYPHELSGGMRQRVVIALALAWEPPLLILDEPTTALDVIVERQILRELLALQSELGFAVLFITHDLGLLMEFADRVAVMRSGRLVEQGPREQLQTAPAHPYTRELLSAAPSAAGPRDPQLLPRDPEGSGPGDLLLEVQQLSKRFPVSGGWWRREWLEAVRPLSFSIRRGECVALVGASGSGKSTVARMVCQLLEPSGGSMLLDGEPLKSGGSLAQRRRVQMIFQDPFASLNAIHSVRHHLLRPLRIHDRVLAGEEDETLLALLERVGLTPAARFLDAYPHELSGGQRQRVAIARALAVEPELIVADEPTSMLDVSIRLDTLRLLHRLREAEGVAYLFITHDLAAARYFADRVLVMCAGELVEEGPAEQLVTSPQHPYTQQLVAAASPGWRHHPLFLEPTESS